MVCSTPEQLSKEMELLKQGPALETATLNGS